MDMIAERMIAAREDHWQERDERVAASLAVPASVAFRVERAAKGRSAGRRCTAETRDRRPPCKLFTPVPGGFFHLSRDGGNQFRFSGRVAGEKLKPGSYRLVGVPTDTALNKGSPARAGFRIAGR